MFGDGVFEVVRAYGGALFRLDQHLKRLADSLAAIELSRPIDAAEVRRHMTELLAANSLRDARLRLTVTGGLHDGVMRLRRSRPATVIITALPLAPPTAEVYRDGVDLVLSSHRRPWASPLARVKTIHRLDYLMAREEALRQSAWDALLLDDRGGLAEGASSNIFLATGNRLATPGLDGPILAGVTREATMDAARGIGLEVEERRVPLAELWRADEVFLTATSWEVLGVRSVDDRPVGGGRVGPTTARVHEAFRNLVRRETGEAR